MVISLRLEEHTVPSLQQPLETHCKEYNLDGNRHVNSILKYIPVIQKARKKEERRMKKQKNTDAPRRKLTVNWEMSV